MEITGEVGKRKAETPKASGGEPSREQPETLQVTVVVLKESDFALDIHQVILLEPCYGLPLVAKDGGGSELNYSEGTGTTLPRHLLFQIWLSPTGLY